MAMLISLVSFAQDAPIYELVPASGTNNGYAANCDITIDGIKWNLTGNSTMQPWRIGGKGITNQDRALYSKTPLAYNIDKIEVIHGTASGITVNSFKLIISDEANGAGETIDVAFKASATTTIDLPEGDYTNKYFKFLYNVTNSTNNNKYLQFTGAKFYAALAEDAVKAPVITGAEDFISETEVTIEAENDVTVYYTLDGTEPTTASTVYAAPFTVKETTTVKAIAYRGETASFVTSATFTQATRVTAAEAAELAMKVASNNALTSVTYVINAYVTSVIDQTLSNGQQRFWVADTKDGGQVLQSYYCNVPQVLKVGDYIQMFGKLTKYNTSPQMKNGDVTIAEEPVIEEPTIECKDALDFGAVAYNAEVAAQTLEVAGYNLTSDITVTLSEGAAFTVDQTTLSAEGGNLVVTPVSPLTVGTHTATLTLASGEATAEVTLTIVAKDVYTITWSVNGETSTTSVVEGDKLVLPAAPEAPEACSEKVFVGWTAAEEVNADGSEIEWATAATIPTTSATYYAVFAAQEGEGGAAEEGTVTLAYTGTTTSNMDVEANNATIVGLDETKWNVKAAKGDNSNAPGLNKAGDIRLYYGDPTSNTITVTSLDETVTISTIVITYTGDDYSNGKILVNDAAVTGTDGTYEINANSFTITNGNTTNVQVRIKNIVINYTTGAAVTYTDYSTTCEAEIEWMPMELEINNLTTEVMEVAGAKYLMMMGGNEEMGESVNIFLNNYADVDDDYEVNAESSLIVYMGYEFTVMEGTISQTSETEKGTLYTGTIYAYTEIEGETMYAAFTLTMYATPVTVLVLTDAIVAINEELGTLTFNIPTGEGEGYYAELANYTAPGVHEGPQICLFESPEVVAFANYVETSVTDGVITLTGEFTSFMGAKIDLTISGTLPVEEPIEMVGVVKRAVQLGESTVVLTHEADGTAHIYNIVGEEIAEVSQVGVIARDPENAGDLLAISDIAVTEDGKLVAINYMHTQAGDSYVNEGQKRGETRVYLWNDLAGDPSILFTSKMSSNWFRSKQGLTMAVKGTSDNMEIFTTGIHATSAWARVSSYRVIDGVYVEPEVNHNDHYFFYDVNDAIALETTVGTQYELNASPLGDMNWILDAELINPTEIVESASNNVEIATSVALNVDLGKKYNGTTYLTIDEQAIMVAPYADAEGLLAGVKVLDITAGLASATEVAVADLDAAVEATAAATAVVVDEDKLFITLVGDATLYTLTAELTQDPGPGTALDNIAVEGKAVKAIINGQLIIIKNGVQYNAQGQVIK